MKITRYDQQHIAIHSYPTTMWLLGIGFVISAVIGVLFLSSQSILTCARAESICNLEEKTLLKTMTLSIPLGQLVSAEVYTNDEIYGGESYKILLNTTNGTILLTSYSARDYNSHVLVADEINTFISNPALPSLEVKQGSRMFLYIISAIFVVIGLLFFVLSRRVTLDLDRTKGLATLKRANLLKSSTDEIQLETLAKAEVQSSREQNGMTFRVTLVPHAGKRIPLTKSFSSGYKDKQKMAEAINHFLEEQITSN